MYMCKIWVFCLLKSIFGYKVLLYGPNNFINSHFLNIYKMGAILADSAENEVYMLTTNSIAQMLRSKNLRNPNVKMIEVNITESRMVRNRLKLSFIDLVAGKHLC